MMKAMKKIKPYRYALLFLITAVILTGVNFTQAQSGFYDLSAEHRNYTAIMDLQKRGIISGYSDGSFRPDIKINRAEALKIILLGAGYDVPQINSNAGFTDVEGDSWYAKYIVKAKELNIIEGYPDRTFKPYQQVNLVENLKILINANNIDPGNIIVLEDPYRDTYKNQWYSKYIAYAKAKNLISADAENKVYPSDGLTRGKLAEILFRFISLTEKTKVQAEDAVKITTNPPISTSLPAATSGASTPILPPTPTTTTTTPGNGGGTLQSTYFTSYGYNDNDDGFGHYGTAAIAYPDSIHPIATEGSGTYADPVTFATDPREIPKYSIIYVPYLQKYFRMDDGCAECTRDWDNGHKWRTDLFMGGNSALQPGPALTKCEEYITRKDIMYINPGPGYTVDTTPLFSGGACTARLH